MKRAERSFRELSAAEARRALYIDFEGEKDRPPVLLGAHQQGQGAYVYLLDDDFSACGEVQLTLHGAIERIVQRAEARNRRIVAWSEHELKVVRGLGDQDPILVARFEARFVNALSLSKYWRNKLYDCDKPAEGRLVDYLALIDYPVPNDALGGDVGATIRAIRQTLARGAPSTEHQRERWRRLVEHNRHDCIGMRRLCIEATRELETTSRRRLTLYAASS